MNAPAKRSSGWSSLPTSTTAILITAIVVCFLVGLSITAFLLYNRRTEQRYRDACKKDPYLSRKEFKRRSNMSATERIKEDELQRRIMIRKSLASRTSSQAQRNNGNYDANVAMSQVENRDKSPADTEQPWSGRQTEDVETCREVAPPFRGSRSRSPSLDRSPLLEQDRTWSPPPHPNRFGRPYHGLPSMTDPPPQIDAESLQFGQDLCQDGNIHRYIWKPS